MSKELKIEIKEIYSNNNYSNDKKYLLAIWANDGVLIWEGIGTNPVVYSNQRLTNRSF